MRVLFAVALGVLVLIVSAPFLLAEEVNCPANARSCKIIAVSPEEEQWLVTPNGVFDMAEWASRPLGVVINAWKQKLGAAKTITPKVEEPKKP